MKAKTLMHLVLIVLFSAFFGLLLGVLLLVLWGSMFWADSWEPFPIEWIGAVMALGFLFSSAYLTIALFSSQETRTHG